MKYNKGNVIGTMVFCVECKAVVWAIDSDRGDVRGILNQMRIPCRLCGSVGSFDQFGPRYKENDYDGWTVMRKLAESEGLEWENGGGGEWFGPVAQQMVVEAVRGERRTRCIARLTI